MDGWMDELMGVWCVHVHIHVYEVDGWMDELMGVCLCGVYMYMYMNWMDDGWLDG